MRPRRHRRPYGFRSSSRSLRLSGCEQNSFVPPPPPKVDVGVPVQQPSRVISMPPATPRRSRIVDLVARVQGVLQSINYKDGAFVKEGTHAVHDRARNLQAETRPGPGGGSRRAGVAEAGRSRLQAPGRSGRSGRRSRRRRSIPRRPTRDNAQANLQQAQANTKIAAVNYGYTNVVAPFDGIVSAHLVSVGELVGAASPTQLATIVQLDPIYVNFNVNEQDVLRIRAEAKRRGMTASRSQAVADRGRTADRKRLSAQGQARLCGADHQPVDRNAGGARRSAESRPRLAARLLRSRPRSLRPAAGRAAGARRGAGQRPGRTLCAGGERRQCRRAAQGRRPGRSRATCA